MKKIILYTCALAAMLASCQSEDGDFVYQSNDNIYFGLGITAGLTITEVEDQKLMPVGVQDPRKMSYSFAIEQKATDTIYIPVTISGLRAPMARRFKVSVIQDSTTAQAGLHYKAFEELYFIPADSGGTMLPVILLNKDPEMETRTFRIGLELVPSDDFDVTVPESKFANIMFSNRLERPLWWTNWEGELGSYSRTKHALYLIALDDIEDKDLIPNFNGENGLLIPYNLFLIGQFRALLIDPYMWVDEHPNYVIGEVGEDTYEFYNVNNGFKKYKMVYNDQAGDYQFIDENGKVVSTDF